MLSGLQALAALFVLLPGFLSSSIARAMSAHKRSDFERIVEAFLFSFITYTIYIPFFGATLPVSWVASADRNGPHYSFPIAPGRFTFIVCVAIMLGVGWGFIEARAGISRLLRRLNLTNRSSGDSLWDDILLRQKGWVQVSLEDGRDVVGWLAAYSDSGEERSLYLERATIMDEHGNKTDIPGPGVLLTNDSKIQMVIFLNQA